MCGLLMFSSRAQELIVIAKRSERLRTKDIVQVLQRCVCVCTPHTFCTLAELGSSRVCFSFHFLPLQALAQPRGELFRPVLSACAACLWSSGFPGRNRSELVKVFLP